jgi:magnesium chelatase subunit D
LSTLDGRALAGPEYLARACDLTGVSGLAATDEADGADTVPMTGATPHHGPSAPSTASGPRPVRVTAAAGRPEAISNQSAIVPPEDQPSPAQQPAEPAPAARPVRRITPGAAGAQRARTVAALGTAEIAVVATLLEAAVHQRERCPAHFDAAPPENLHPLHVRREDLRQYRHDRPARLTLVLLVDHTCLRGWDWTAALAPYLREVYVARGPVDVIEVGSAAAPFAARATMLRAHGALDPRLDMVLSRSAGGATPLAHGLDLASAALRRAARHNRQTAGHGLLVVVTDGLGNVPREASRRGRLPARAGAEGVADALAAARRIRSLQRVTSVLVRPPAIAHDGVFRRLAAGLGAAVVQQPEPSP